MLDPFLNLWFGISVDFCKVNEDKQKNADRAFLWDVENTVHMDFQPTKVFAKRIFSQKVFPFRLKVRPPIVDLYKWQWHGKTKQKQFVISYFHLFFFNLTFFIIIFIYYQCWVFNNNKKYKCQYKNVKNKHQNTRTLILWEYAREC